MGRAGAITGGHTLTMSDSDTLSQEEEEEPPSSSSSSSCRSGKPCDLAATLVIDRDVSDASALPGVATHLHALQPRGA